MLRRSNASALFRLKLTLEGGISYNALTFSEEKALEERYQFGTVKRTICQARFVLSYQINHYTLK